MNLLDSSLEELERLEEMSSKCETCDQACKLRNEVRVLGEHLAKLCAMLEKDEKFPDLDDFLIY